jgi:co-chaperonin GroES (HSP10)
VSKLVYHSPLVGSPETHAAKLPIPRGWHMLIALPSVKEQTDGGVFIPDEVRAREETAAVTGQVIAMGDRCYKNDVLFGAGADPWCQVTDWVVFKPYSGVRIVVDEREYRILKDNEIVAVVSNPSGIIRSSRV